eukprot:269145_1
MTHNYHHHGNGNNNIYHIAARRAPRRRAPLRRAPAAPVSWTCQYCTLINNNTSKYCTLCGREDDREEEREMYRDCPICNKAIKVSYFKKHFDRLHNKEKKKCHKCTLCSKRFSRKEHLRDHTLIHVQQKPHACPWCAKPFRTKSQLKTHCLKHVQGL